MLSKYYEQIEVVALYMCLFGLFLLMGYVVHDVMKRNDVPAIGRMVTYGVLCLGALGFIAKGVIEVFWQLSGV